MDIFQMLKADHRTVEALFVRVCKTTERGARTRREILARIRAELELHMMIEESVLYPVLREMDEMKDMALDAYAEHFAATDLITKLEGVAADDEMWKAWMGVLRANIEHHVEDEEQELFPKAKKHLEAEQVREMTERAKQMKREKPPLRRGRTGARTVTVERRRAAKIARSQ